MKQQKCDAYQNLVDIFYRCYCLLELHVIEFVLKIIFAHSFICLFKQPFMSHELENLNFLLVLSSGRFTTENGDFGSILMEPNNIANCKIKTLYFVWCMKNSLLLLMSYSIKFKTLKSVVLLHSVSFLINLYFSFFLFLTKISWKYLHSLSKGGPI